MHCASIAIYAWRPISDYTLLLQVFVAKLFTQSKANCKRCHSGGRASQSKHEVSTAALSAKPSNETSGQHSAFSKEHVSSQRAVLALVQPCRNREPHASISLIQHDTQASSSIAWSIPIISLDYPELQAARAQNSNRTTNNL
ncbi:hypothetical protein HBI56_045380 [Parastagonospora nodorum]|nr:hypothetical protein HBH51_151210 [Parastagonospora nodorum]KAH4121576.1 hypothetical protein HBH47_099400 [Parastagonospora nodorum]KAH4194341.1 hypothetical protein HBH42_096060 [Parastagonospora nodorum]KAH4254064.1 hypothetical protein HBI03_189870 [Parastagonospora nodorum]KAH4265674.1 hypothetical protein HBI04_181050 [Parastagonospora nodorum]